MGLKNVPLLTDEEVKQHEQLVADLYVEQERASQERQDEIANQIKHLNSELDEHYKTYNLKRKVY